MENLKEIEATYVEDDELLGELISAWTFFSPSAELTKLILVQNDKLGNKYFEKQYQDTFVPVESHSTNIFRGLQRAADILFHKSDQEGSERLSEKEVVSGFQAFFSERIFNHLAMLSRTPYARIGTFSIKEELTIELAEKIGLGLYLHKKTSSDLKDETQKILLALAREFQYWFIEEQEGIFHTLWGSMFSVDNEDLRGDMADNSIILIPDVLIPDVEEGTDFATWSS